MTNANPKHYPRGSEWRKWDLHLHSPGTKLNDGYGGLAELDRFCNELEASDVAVFGITDYFSADGFFATKNRFQELYPKSEKVLLSNIEMRLSETVNKAGDPVDIHFIFRPDVTREIINRFLAELKTEITEPSGRRLACSELQTKFHFEHASVTRESIESAIEETFGKRAVRSDHLLVVVPANGNGIRGDTGQQRKLNLADQIDKLSDAIWGTIRSTDYFLGTNRFEDPAQRSKPKPVFACSDAHSFDQLQNWLGRESNCKENHKEVTWIKGDLTFEGLLQTLYEPANRVRLQVSRPETKEPYKVISAVHFSGGEFPENIPLNDSLVSVIGSRSSGKSSLLAYIAHSIDPDYTVAQQVATGLMSADKVGPAAGKTWKEVSHINCRIEWGDPNATQGKVIYIPQNSLFAVSERPGEITQKIAPMLFMLDPGLEIAHSRLVSNIDASKEKIRTSVARWFRLDEQMASLRQELRGLGDPVAVGSTRNELVAQIAQMRTSVRLSDDEIAQYQEITAQLTSSTSRRNDIAQEKQTLAPYLTRTGDQIETAGISVSITVIPPAESFPAALEAQLRSIIDPAGSALNAAVRKAIVDYQISLEAEEATLLASEEELRIANAALIQRNEGSVELETLINRHRKQEEVLNGIVTLQKRLDEYSNLQAEQVGSINAEIGILDDHIDVFVQEFESKPRTLTKENMIFGVEHQINDDILQALTAGFDRRENTDYVERSSEIVKISNVREDPGTFLRSLRDGAQKIRMGVDAVNLATQVLTVSQEVRFVATLEDDRIGGFKRSSMTPGKQSLFALSLILNESEDGWPLLIDQPEDDLDSRSIFDAIVPYLVKRKRDRQIIMVSRDANLVVGADSDQVIVANRHGDDRRNNNGQTFDYLTGSLEYTFPETATPHVLEKCGIREHACEILDGGTEAFQKRRDKYNI